MLTSSAARVARDPIESVEFRRVLGHYPSGVVAVTSPGAPAPTGMIVSSFTSVSLDPPLVAFLPAKSSSTFEAIERAGVFCVNVLSSAQEDICRRLAAKGPDKLAGVDWRPAPSGAPILNGTVAWIDCEIEATHDAGDHWIVIGRVHDLRVEAPDVPLLFFQGGYGRFAPLSISAVGAPDLVEQLRLVDELRAGMVSASRELGVEILATACIGDELVAVATSGHPDPERLPTRIGQRMPYIPPLGALFAAWSDPESWILRSGLVEEVDHLRRMVGRVRDRGWSVMLGDSTPSNLERALARMSVHEPTPEQRRAVEELIDPLASDYEPETLVDGVAYPLRTVAVPVLDDAGAIRLTLIAYGLPPTSTLTDLERYLDRLFALSGSRARSGMHAVAGADSTNSELESKGSK